MPKIVVKNKVEIVKEYVIGKGKVTVGRVKGNSITLDDEAISEEHCVISRIDNKLVLEDLNTAFGTTVNGKVISKQEISIGDEIGVGNHLLSIKPSGKEKVKKSAIGDSRIEAYLLGIQGKMDGRKFELNPVETRIGRAKDFNDIWILKTLDKSVSRRHATINYTDGKFILTDKRSRNRTFVNQQQVNETDEVALKSGDEILIGKSIFRFIIGRKEDYSTPKKAGIFLIRFFPKLKKIIAALALMAGLLLNYEGIKGLSIISSKPADIYIDNLNFKPENFIRTWKGYFPKETFDITPSPAIGNINTDKAQEIVMADAMGRVYVWGGRGGNLLWQSELGQSKLTSPVLADINNDGVLDVVVGSDNSRVYVLDGISGQVLYKSDFIGGKLLFGSSPLVDDIDGDGFNDIIVVTDDKIVCFLYSPITGSKEPYFFKTPEDILSSPVFLDNLNGQDKVAIATNGGKIYLFDVINPESREVIDVTQKINMLKGVNLILNEISSVPAVADLDGDGIQDLVFTTGAYYIVALNGKTQSLLWAYKIRPFSTLVTPFRYASPVVTDLDMDGKPDVITGWANGKVIALNGHTGKPLWEHYTDQDNRIISSIALADFNKDGIMDPVVVGEDGSVVILNGSVNVKERMLSNKAFVRGAITSTPAIGDINGDGYIEIVVTAVNNNIYVFTTPTRVFKNEMFWRSFRQDADNTGSLFYISKGIKYQAFTGSGVFLIIGVLVVTKIAKKKKFKRRPEVIKG